MNIQELDKYLCENCAKPKYVIMHPLLWGGYWRIPIGNKMIRKVFRDIGRRFHNKYVYCLGCPIRWETGVKELVGEGIEFYDIYS